MANEPSIVELYGPNSNGDPRSYTVANGTGITKYTVMVLGSDPRTAIAHSAATQIPVGIANQEKTASDGVVRMGVFRRGVFDMIASGAIALGQKVKLAAEANMVMAMDSVADNTSSLAIVVGTCLETASTGERVNIAINLT